MKRMVSFTAGFAAGWLARSTVATSHEAFVNLGAVAYSTVERIRRIVALERERVDDLVAEARARVAPEREKTTGKGDGVRAEAATRSHERAA